MRRAIGHERFGELDPYDDQARCIDGGITRIWTPVIWTEPDTQQVAYFHMLLREELPAPAQGALERPLF